MHELKHLTIERTPKTPQVDLDQSSGELRLTGKSIPENAARIYEPVIELINKYVLQAKPVTNLRINLEYYNTASSIWISKMLKALTKIANPDYLLLVHLYVPVEEYDDMKEFSDIKEAFSPITNILHNTIPSVGLKLYATDDRSEIVRDALVLM